MALAWKIALFGLMVLGAACWTGEVDPTATPFVDTLTST